MTKTQQSERDEFIAKLRETLKPGDTLHTVLRSVSRSGMNRKIDVYKLECGSNGDGVSKSWLSYWIAKASGESYDTKRECLSVGGCGMNMEFAVVYNLSRALWPAGFGVPCSNCHRRAASPEEAKQLTENGAHCTQAKADDHFKHVFRGRNGDTSGWDTDGGYALHQEWL